MDREALLKWLEGRRLDYIRLKAAFKTKEYKVSANAKIDAFQQVIDHIRIDLPR